MGNGKWLDNSRIAGWILSAYKEGLKDAMGERGSEYVDDLQDQVKKHEAEMLEAEMVMRDLLNELAGESEGATTCTDPTCHEHARSQNARKWLKARAEARKA